ncbi:MAG: ferredoxin [Solirubrobacterales bacterium]|nr:ferredoxin [Solirubrobacterales bacterium]
MNCRAEVDANSCSGHGDCVAAAPTIFRLEDEIAEVLNDGPEDLLIKAAESCPAAAIAVFDGSSGEQIYP